MHVHWKSLCSLGFMFWAGMSGIDHYYGNIVIPAEFFNTIPEPDPVIEQIIPEIVKPPENDKTPALETSYCSYMFLSLITLILSVSVTVAKIVYKKSFYNRISVTKGEVVPSNITSKNLYTGYDLFEPPCDKLVVLDEPKLELCPSTRYKTKDETVETTSSWKELAALTKRVDTLEEEKRNLGKILAQAERDNHGIKQKMMEILRDKNVLLKRLESATREIRSNTVARQATLDKLEESLQCSTQLKKQVQQITSEKNNLEKKIKELEMQLKTSKKQLQKQLKENISSASSSTVPVDSGRDIEQIELKLHDLEASLEKMKCKSMVDDDGEGESENDSNETSDSLSEPKILRQVSSNDLTFLTEVEPSYTNLLAHFDGRHQIVESIEPKSVACKLSTTPANKFHVLNNLFGSAISRLLLNIQRNQAECMNSIVRRHDPVVINYSVDCKYLRQLLQSNDVIFQPKDEVDEKQQTGNQLKKWMH